MSIRAEPMTCERLNVDDVFADFGVYVVVGREDNRVIVRAWDEYTLPGAFDLSVPRTRFCHYLGTVDDTNIHDAVALYRAV